MEACSKSIGEKGIPGWAKGLIGVMRCLARLLPGLVTLVGVALVLALQPSGGRAAEDKTVWYIADYATAKNDLSLRHQHAWRLYNLYKAANDAYRAFQNGLATNQAEFNATYGAGGLSSAFGAAMDDQIQATMADAQANMAALEETRARIRQAWSHNDFDVYVGSLDLVDEIIDAEYDDPDAPGTRKELKIDRIAFRLLTGKAITIFRPAAPVPTAIPAEPVQPADESMASSGKCPPCPAGKKFCWCKDGQTICYDPSAGEGCIPPSEEEFPDEVEQRGNSKAPPVRTREQNINDILRGTPR